MTIQQAATQLGISPQALRVWIAQSQGNHPFGEVIRSGKRKSYLIVESRFKAWLEGDKGVKANGLVND